MQENKNVVLNGKTVTIERFDRVSFKPYSSIYYEVHGFDIFNDDRLMAVYDNLDVISKSIDDIVGVLKVDKRLTWQEKRKLEREKRKALQK